MKRKFYKPLTALVPLVAILLLTGTIMARNLVENEPDPPRSDMSDKTHDDDFLIFTANGSQFKMIKVERGTFEMGCNFGGRVTCYSNERPVHEVTISYDYYIGQYEVTQALYFAVMGKNPSSFKGDNRPVENVSWMDAIDFCVELSRITGLNFSLPTEAEWEYAARGGQKSTGTQYSGSNSVRDVAWGRGNSGAYKGRGQTNSVGRLRPNELGIYDMSGNVWEWCEDWYDDSYRSHSQIDPNGPSSGSSRVLRGGSWLRFADESRVSFRYSLSPDSRNFGCGFRVVLRIPSGADIRRTSGGFDPNTSGGASESQNSSSQGNGGSAVQGQDFTETAYGINMRMIYVEGGTFNMGCTSEQSDCDDDELPTRTTTVSSFHIGMLEVTQDQWEKVMGTNVHQFSSTEIEYGVGDAGAYGPMYCVSWEDAKEFCARLSRQTGRNYSLPTEAEWEYAARGGNRDEGTKYSGGWSLGDVAWYDDNSGWSTNPCGTKRPNALGIYDMSGNVWEWCEDWYGTYINYDNNNPKGAASGSSRVLRGGSGYDNAVYCRISNRNFNSPDYRSSYNGFRVVLR